MDPEQIIATYGADDDELKETDRINPIVLQFSTMLFPYKVQDGDSLKNIGKRIGCSWQELAILNWGTDDPDEINWYLGNYFVCTKKSGSNYLFTSKDEPGILMLPRPMDPADLKLRRTIMASRWPRSK